MSNLFTTTQSRKCTVCAYHESGHILFAYLCGYHCRYAELVEEGEDDWSAVAVIDYGTDAAMAAKLTAETPDLDYFRCLSLGEKLEYMETGRRLVRIFLGGSVAAAVYQNNGNVQIPLPIQLDYLDLMRVESIQSVIRELSTEGEEQLVEYGLQEALYTAGNVNIWNTISDLAERLLRAGQLNRNDIEECLDEHGIIYDQASPADQGLDF